MRGIDCLGGFAVLCVRFRSRTLPACRSYRDAARSSLLRLGWGCGLRARVRRRFEARGLAKANERAVRAWACVRSGCGWCVNRDLSVTREVWIGQGKGEERQGCELSSAVFSWLLLLLLSESPEVCAYNTWQHQ